ncbi:phosphonopyruvate decarboxylase [Pseudooceanicola sp.]|uniref:phosphonopyruvate decarboxylase n=1 Tax=Pseudooceanicola sp. TaxID=1914328 RepID=UPI0035184581
MTVSTERWGQALVAAGYGFAAGVPCSSLGALQKFFLSSDAVDYIAATNEGQAVATAAGAVMAGRKSVVLMQNSGLGNAVNPLTSLVEPFALPMLLVTSWRGKPGMKDEPQHERMGKATHALLDAMDIPWVDLSTDEAEALAQLSQVLERIETERRCVAIVVADKTFDKTSAAEKPVARKARGRFEDLSIGGGLLSRAEVLGHIAKGDRGTVRLCTTGKTGRELFATEDAETNLYVVGSMGLASSIGLGMALSTDAPVMVIDGDGAALMHLGALAGIGTYGGANLIHLVLDNGTYDSTGGQASISLNAPFAEIAAACGYDAAYRVEDLAGLDHALSAPRKGPVLIHMPILPGSMDDLPRPDKTPVQVLARLRGAFGFKEI